MKKKFRILITWRLLIDNISLYQSSFKKNNIVFETLYGTQFISEKILKNKIPKFDGLICGDDEVTKKVLDKAKNLKVISKWGTGLDSIDLEYARKKNIKVFNSPGAFTDNVTDHALAMMFALNRNIINNHNDLLKGLWTKRLCTNLTGKKIGIIGYGKIGQMIKKKLSGFSVKFLVNDLKKIKIKNHSKNEIYRKSDILFLSVDLNKKSKNMISFEEFKKMKKNLIIINICRGQVINPQALYFVLKNKLISGAGLDVHYKEPIKKSDKFLKLDNCILTSHNAFNSKETIFRINELTIKNLIKGIRSN